MKKIVCLLLLSVALCEMALAQSQYISYKPLEKENREAQLLDMGGILVYSKRGDLVITLTNVKNPIIKRNGVNEEGLYEYEILIDPSAETSQPKLEISKRGDINRTTIMASLQPNYYKAYLIEEVEKPIRVEDQTRSQDVILDEKLAEIEIETPLQDLQVAFSEALHAEKETKRKENDNSVFVTTIKIPVANLKEAETKLEEAVKKRDELYNKMLDSSAKVSEEEEQMYDKLDREEIPALEALVKEMNTIEVFAQGTNRVSIDITGIGPRSKRRYGVIVLIKKEIVHVTEYDAMLAEGVRQWNNRDYKAAKTAFVSALNAKDAPADKSLVRSNIADCDSCLIYNKYTSYALNRMAELKKQGHATQDEVKEYASSALEFIQILNNYNPCEFYTKIIDKLEKMIENIPLVIKFTVAQWVRGATGFHQGDEMKGVEVWVNNGLRHPEKKEYQSERRFKKLTEGSAFYRRIGETDAQGTIVVDLDRKALPRGFFFHSKETGKIEYVNMSKITRDSKNDYQMRQFRVMMYTKD